MGKWKLLDIVEELPLVFSIGIFRKKFLQIYNNNCIQLMWDRIDQSMLGRFEVRNVSVEHCLGVLKHPVWRN